MPLCFHPLCLLAKFVAKTKDMEYVLNDESVVNSHGFVLLNAAGRFERFNANPVMLFNHEADKLIGQMTGLRVEGTKLIGTPSFDEEDTLAAKCKRQGEKGFLKGCSPGIIMNAVELRTTPDGEERITVTDWTLCEVSLVSVPSNRNALKLYNIRGEAIPDDQVKLSIESLLNNKTGKEMDRIILTAEAYAALGMTSAEADGKALSAAIMELKARAEKAEKQVEEVRKEKASELVELAVKDGRITADRKEQFKKLALADFSMAKETLESIPPKESLSAKIVHKATATKERAEWTYLKWAKEDPEGLKRLKETDPEAFEELKKRIR